MRRLGLFLLAWVMLFAFAACQRAGQTQPPAPIQYDFSGSLLFGGLTRTYQGHLPSGYADAKLLPLVLALHGNGGDGQGMQRLTHLNSIMSQRLACDLSNKIAAAASVAAMMPVGLAARCAPKRPVPFLLMQGTDDPFVPVQGGVVKGERGTVVSASATIQKWVSIDGCPASPTAGNEPNTANDGTSVSYQLYSGCRNGSEVALYLVEGGGHTWPGGLQYLPAALVGKTSRDIDAGEVIWSFFQPRAD